MVRTFTMDKVKSLATKPIDHFCNEDPGEFQFASAEVSDTAEIIGLYNISYEGQYPELVFTSYQLLKNEILRKNKKLFVARDEDQNVVACISFLYDPYNRIAKAGSAVVSKEAQGKNLTRKLIEYGVDDIQATTKGIALLYITTRTVHRIAQHLTDNMGFKKLGIFPNAHKTKDYETHVLGGLYFEGANDHRYSDFKQHPRVMPIFNIAKDECDLPEMEIATDLQLKNFHDEPPVLEFIHAKEFVKTSYDKAKKNKEIELGFFPFHEPSTLITSPDGAIQVFASINKIDNQCVIIGFKIDHKVSFTSLFLKVSSMLRDLGVRYIEMIARANRLNIIEKIIQAKFIPCGYVPSFQLEVDKRYDYVVFSKSFEILEFNNIELTGVSNLYLKEYIKTWSEISLSKFLSVSI
jgi:N-acetylglutamate synthase-like GNAT family acetyltransferase